MLVPFLDLKRAYDALAPELEAALLASARSGWYILGQEVETFEAEFASYCGARHAVGVSNGLDALKLALLAVGVTAGDEVIVPSHTFIATWLAVSACGATPVPVEPDPLTFNMDVRKIEAAVSMRTRAIVPVHLYGHSADMDPILDIAKRHGLAVVEDAAQAQGARYRGQRIGGHSHIVSWSFYPGKNLGGLGDAGAITTNDSVLAERTRQLRNYGSAKKYEHEMLGFNCRLDPIQATVLSVKLRHLDQWNSRRQEIAARYRTEIVLDGLTLTDVAPWADPVWHLFVIRHPARAQLQAHLDAAGVSTQIHYPIALHKQPAYAGFDQSLPLAETMAATVLSLPIGPQMTDAEVTHVINVLNAFGH